MSLKPLTSWKEIAAYLGHSIRTVQRWERDLGLPIHRPSQKENSSVMAFSEDLDRWLRSFNKPVSGNRPCSSRPVSIAPLNTNALQNERTISGLLEASDLLDPSALAQEIDRLMLDEEVLFQQMTTVLRQIEITRDAIQELQQQVKCCSKPRSDAARQIAPPDDNCDGRPS